MDITITPKKLHGTVNAIPSKSQAHRLLICAAFADAETQLYCADINRDIAATASCLRALGADIERTEWGYRISPVITVPKEAALHVQDSGSTLRFLLPVCGALGVDTVFHMESRLPERPLSPLWEEMERMGCKLSRPTYETIHLEGKLHSGVYSISGSVSSQFITGLLLASALMDGESQIQITGKLESEPYVTMTKQAMELFGCSVKDYRVNGGKRLHTPGKLAVEGDWSNGAFFLAANALGSNLTIGNLNPQSAQGDRAAKKLIPALRENISIDASDIPDLIPILSVVAAQNKGAVFTNIRRLRLKESDRVASIIQMLGALGANASAEDNQLTVFPSKLRGGTVDAARDHRIAMSAAIAATACEESVTILGAECVDKSYPGFFQEYLRLGGQYEQYLR